MMDPSRNNPYWGVTLYCSDDTDDGDSLKICCTDDTAAMELDPLNMDDAVVNTVFMNSRDWSPIPYADITDLLNNDIGDKKAMTMEIVIRPQPGGPQMKVVTEPQPGGSQTEMVIRPQPGGPQMKMVTEPQPGGSQTEMVIRPQPGGPQMKMVMEPQPGSPQTKMVTGPQPGGSHQYELPQIKGEDAGYDEEQFQELICDVISGTPEANYEFRVAGEEVQGKEKKPSKTYQIVKEMDEDLLVAKMEHDIPIEVVGAQSGQSLTISLRYKTGCHYDTPVVPCIQHGDKLSDKNFSFSIPKLNGVKKDMDGVHPTLNVPVPILPLGEDFKFSLLFHCLNSCHTKYGKNQEIILKLYDSQGKQLHERCINIRICANLKRDINVLCDKHQGKGKGVKRLRGKNTKITAGKRMKTEEEVAVGAAASTHVDQPLIIAEPFRFGVEFPNNIHFSLIANLVKALNGKVFDLEDTAAPPLPYAT